MDFKQLEVFVAVCKYQSFSKAARELFLTQPTVSSHIQNLEKELDTVLINRNNKNITLTKSGEILYSHAIKILNNCKKAIYDIKEYSGKIEGTIDIACSSIPESYILPTFIKNFTLQYPDVKFSINNYNSQVVISEILDEKISFGLVGYKPNNAQIQYIDLMDDELVLITPKDILLDNDNGYINITKLNNLRFIMRKEGSATRNIIISKLKEYGFNVDNLDIIAHVESNNSILEMVKLGLGASFVSYISVASYLDNNKLNIYKIKNLELKRKFYFIYSKKKILTPLENKFVYNLYEFFNKNIL